MRALHSFWGYLTVYHHSFYTHFTPLNLSY
nr:MAG TPA: hypothetical protein [Bacteriophage sp.]